MKRTLLSFIAFSAFLLLTSCGGKRQNTFVLAFGSCNNTELPNYLWEDIIEHRPDLWVWGGDIIYADTEDMQLMKKMYEKQNDQVDYRRMVSAIPVMGTWDDHDYGINDGGGEYQKKEESQQLLLDFLGVSKEDRLRERQGIYTSKVFPIGEGSVKVIVLDTRYFRTPLTPDTTSSKRYRPNQYGEGTLLGEAQWKWLEKELNDSESEFNVIISSIQFLSDKHGFEAWGNFPHEQERLEQMIISSKPKGVIILSGDRHISEFSKKEIAGMPYPLLDFTSSGLTHAYHTYKGESNPWRVGEVIATESYGLLYLNTGSGAATFQMRGKGDKLLQELEQRYSYLNE